MNFIAYYLSVYNLYMDIPSYIAERVRKPVPKESDVIKGSTPVISFGNATKARVATLGINPSKREFLNDRNEWLAEDSRRLATYISLGLKDITNASDEQVSDVISGCNNYFQQNPYKHWFDPLEKIIYESTGASYYDGSACHLDLVQWATQPTWRNLPRNIKDGLIKSDREFLRLQLSNEKIKIVIINGGSVITQVQGMGIDIKEDSQIALGKVNYKIFKGHKDGVKYVGWSVNLQSSPGVSNLFKDQLTQQITKILTT